MLPYKESSSAEDLAYMFIKTIFAYYKMLNKIILNRNKLFILKF